MSTVRLKNVRCSSKKGKRSRGIVPLTTARSFFWGQALQIAKILQKFTGRKPLKVLDFAEPGIFEKKAAHHREHREN
jgi:hypothetical protein